MTHKLRLGVLASGGGTNLQAILDRCGDGRLSAEVVVVISNEPTAYVLERAKQSKVPAVVLNHREYPDRNSHDLAIVDMLKAHNVELVVLAGYMRVLTAAIFDAYAGRIINIHPALIPAFCGKGMYGHHVHQAVIDYGAKVSGVTVHFVESGVDTGPIILQHCIPVRDDDTAESLAGRILKFEHEEFSTAIQLIAEGRIKLEGRRVRILPPQVTDHKDAK